MATIAEDTTKADMDDLTRLFQQTRINEAEEYIKKRKVAVINFGRLNPPTRGHYKLLEYIADQAKLLGGKGFVFLSASQNYLPPHKGTQWRPVVNRVTKSTFRSNKSNENPLSVWDKWELIHKFPPIENIEYINPMAVSNTSKKERPYTMDRAADYLRNKGYTDIYLVVGTDRFKQLKDKGVEKTWNLTLIEHPRSERLEDLTLYSIDKTIPKKSLAINPEAISGTKSRAAAAEHAINGIKGIDSMTLRQAKEAIMNRRNPMHQSHGFITFKEYMPSILTDSELEFIIYKIKKGMLLRPSQSYINNHKKNRMVRRSSMTKKKGGKRRKKKTRKKRGGERLHSLVVRASRDILEFWRYPSTSGLVFVPEADNYINSNRFRENLSNEFKWANIPENITDFTYEDTAKFEQIKENQKDLLSKWIPRPWNTQSGEGRGGGKRRRRTRRKKKTRKKRKRKGRKSRRRR